MQFWPRDRSKTITLGLEFKADAIAIAALRGAGQAPASLTVLERSSEQTVQQQLKSWVTQQRLTKTRCNIVLGSGSYQMVLIEPPAVPEEELRAAVRWRLKDLIAIPPEQSVVDIFELPQDGTRANKKLIYAVAADRAELSQYVEAVELAGLQLQVIDVPELAFRNLLYCSLPEHMSDRGVVLARLGEGAGSIYVYRQRNLYLARNFKLDYKAGVLDEIPEQALALELQRSMDYYERQMGQAPPSAVYLCGEHVTSRKIGETLKNSVSAPVELLNVDIFSEGSEGLAQQCLAAAGGALRGSAA